jgi:hypothetical protein
MCLAGVLLSITLMRTRHAFAVLIARLFMTPVVLFVGVLFVLLLIPVTLLLVAVSPFVGIAALLTFIVSAPRAEESRGPRAHPRIPTVVYHS